MFPIIFNPDLIVLPFKDSLAGIWEQACVTRSEPARTVLEVFGDDAL